MKLASLLFLTAPVFAQQTPDQFFETLKQVLTARQADNAQIATLKATVADLNTKLVLATNSCISIPQPWQDIIKQILSQNQPIAGVAFLNGKIISIAHIQTPEELAQWKLITGKDHL